MAQKKTILIIDDEPSVADALHIILDDKGYDVVVAMTGREGLEQAGKRKFDLTITDLRLPDMTGLDVLSRIRESDPEGLVILITAYETPDFISESVKRGAVAVLGKPFYPYEVLDLIDRLLNCQQAS